MSSISEQFCRAYPKPNLNVKGATAEVQAWEPDY